MDRGEGSEDGRLAITAWHFRLPQRLRGLSQIAAEELPLKNSSNRTFGRDQERDMQRIFLKVLAIALLMDLAAYGQSLGDMRARTGTNRTPQMHLGRSRL